MGSMFQSFVAVLFRQCKPDATTAISIELKYTYDVLSTPRGYKKSARIKINLSLHNTGCSPALQAADLESGQPVCLPVSQPV